MIGIYKFTNKTNGKSYIGQSGDIERRYKEHKNRKENSIFHEAINEFGFENFDFSVVEVCDINELNDKEIFYIKKYNTLVPNGYNVSEGGYCGHPMGLSSVKDVSTIIDLLKNTNMTNLEIGLLYGVSDQTISDINNGRTWRNDSYAYPIRKRKIIKKSFCKICGKELYKYAKNNLCHKCIGITFKKEPPVTKEELFGLLCNHTFVAVGKKYNVSDNTIRKWCDKYNIPRYSNYYKS